MTTLTTLTTLEAHPVGLCQYVYCAIRFGWWPLWFRRIIRSTPVVHGMFYLLWLRGHSWNRMMFERQLQRYDH